MYRRRKPTGRVATLSSCPYSPTCRVGVFSETVFPVNAVLGSSLAIGQICAKACTFSLGVLGLYM
jgi:hypothetical protein